MHDSRVGIHRGEAAAVSLVNQPVDRFGIDAWVGLPDPRYEPMDGFVGNGVLESAEHFGRGEKR